MLPRLALSSEGIDEAHSWIEAALWCLRVLGRTLDHVDIPSVRRGP